MEGKYCQGTLVWRERTNQKGKTIREQHIRILPWDNPELRKAFREAKNRHGSPRR